MNFHEFLRKSAEFLRNHGAKVRKILRNQRKHCVDHEKYWKTYLLSLSEVSIPPRTSVSKVRICGHSRRFAATNFDVRDAFFPAEDAFRTSNMRNGRARASRRQIQPSQRNQKVGLAACWRLAARWRSWSHLSGSSIRFPGWSRCRRIRSSQILRYPSSLAALFRGRNERQSSKENVGNRQNGKEILWNAG